MYCIPSNLNTLHTLPSLLSQFSGPDFVQLPVWIHNVTEVFLYRHLQLDNYSPSQIFNFWLNLLELPHLFWKEVLYESCPWVHKGSLCWSPCFIAGLCLIPGFMYKIGMDMQTLHTSTDKSFWLMTKIFQFSIIFKTTLFPLYYDLTQQVLLDGEGCWLFLQQASFVSPFWRLFAPVT